MIRSPAPLVTLAIAISPRSSALRLAARARLNLAHRCGRPKRLRNQERRRNRSVGSQEEPAPRFGLAADPSPPPSVNHAHAPAGARVFRYALNEVDEPARRPILDIRTSTGWCRRKRMRAFHAAPSASRVVPLENRISPSPSSRTNDHGLSSTDGTNRAMRSGRSDRPDSSRGFISIGSFETEASRTT